MAVDARCAGQLRSGRTGNHIRLYLACSLVRRERCKGCHRLAGRSKILQEIFAVPREHGDADGLRSVQLVQSLSGNQRKAAISLYLGAPSQSQRFCRGDTDTHTGKASRSAIDENPVRSPAIGKLCDCRDQLLRMAATDFGIVRRNPCANRSDQAVEFVEIRTGAAIENR